MVDGGDQVLLDRPRGDRVGLLAGEHVEVVGGVRQVRPGFDGLQPLPQPVQCGQQGRYGGAGGQRVLGPVLGVEVVDGAEARGGAEQREGGPQACERAGGRGGPGEGGQGFAYRAGQRAQGGGLGGEGGPFGGTGGQRAAEHQVPDVLEGPARGELDG